MGKFINRIDEYIIDLTTPYSLEDDDDERDLKEEVEPEEDYTKDSFARIIFLVTSIVAITSSLWHILFAVYPVIFGVEFRASHILLMGIVVFLSTISIRRDINKWRRHVWNISSIILIVAVILTNIYVILESNIMWMRAGAPTQMDVIVSWTLIILTLEGARRIYGNLFGILGGITILYGLFGNYLPGIFRHGGVSPTRLATGVAVPDLVGVYGTLVDLSATLITLFVIFGIFLQYLGGAKYFGDVAKAVAGSIRSGPAQVSIISSGFMAMISGSAVANAASTGAFTIPLMQRAGYSDDFAAGVESTASIGGQITPPVMGAAAFIIASLLGESYLVVIAAAAIPAFMHYATVMISAHLNAVKNDYEPIGLETQASLTSLILRSYYFVPLLVIIYSLMDGNPALRAALHGLVSLVVLYILFKIFEGGLSLGTFKQIFLNIVKGLDAGTRVMAPIAILLAMIAWMVEVLTLTGLLSKLSSGLIYYAGGTLFLVLLMTATLGIAFSLGLPTTPAYLLVALVAAPALIELGVHPLAAHLFVLYYAILGAVTPPGAPTCLVTSGISGGEFIPTCLYSMRFSFAMYLLPFIWVYNTAIIGIGTPTEIFTSVLSLIILVIAVATFFENFLITKYNKIERIAVLFVSAGIIIPRFELTIISTLIFGSVVVSQMVRTGTHRSVLEYFDLPL